MRKILLAAAPVLALALAAPAFSQGSTQTPPSPNAAVSGPQGGGVPSSARTMPPSAVDQQGAIATTQYPTQARQPSRRAQRRMARRARHNSRYPAAQTVPVPASQ